MSPTESAFLPRPWPERSQERSPLHGARILVVAVSLAAARERAELLSRAGCAAQATSPTELARASARGDWDVLLSLEGVGGPELSELLARSDAPSWIHLAGASPADVTAEPFAVLEPNLRIEQLYVQIGRVLEQRALSAENRELRASLAERSALHGCITRDPRMRAVLGTIEAVADTRANVLLCGETGTGKTLLARAIHQRSSRASGPFVVVDCGSLPSNLLESELFGHVRGAFTGAVRDKAGKFELADGGTLFLDEIHSAPLELQLKLLRAIQDRKFERVGDERTREVDVRILAATNRSLEEEIAAGRFREDLYWRLKVIALELPPLRERARDVAELAELFVGRYAAYYRKPVRGISPAALSLLVAHAWPGNVRELENLIERAVLLATGTEIGPVDLGPGFSAPAAPAVRNAGLLAGLDALAELPPLKEALEQSERALLARALEITGGSRQRTARMLGINRTTLFNKMRKYGLMKGPRSAHEPRT